MSPYWLAALLEATVVVFCACVTHGSPLVPVAGRSRTCHETAPACRLKGSARTAVPWPCHDARRQMATHGRHDVTGSSDLRALRRRFLRTTLTRMIPAASHPETSISGRHKPAQRVLRGEWLGHAAHPMFTDFTVGPWMAASFLDLFGPPGSAPAARRLVALGLTASVPTLFSGLADWATTTGETRRTGRVHAATSSLATALYAASYVARRRGAQRGAVLLGIAGGLVEVADGYIGGELSLVHLAGTGRRCTRGRRCRSVDG